MEPVELEQWKQVTADLICLTGCAVSGNAPSKDRVEHMDLEHVHALAEELKLTAITWMGIESAYAGKDLPDTPLFHTWSEERDHVIRKNWMFSLECDQVTAALEQQGIWYLPLKGIILQSLYPQMGMREMCDVDILFDAAKEEQVRDLFLQRGYTSKNHGIGNVDCYYKEPFYNFEMHVALFKKAPQSGRDWVSYYEDVVSNRTLREEGHPLRRRFTEEDFYVYMVLHSSKHERNGGVGLRTLLDFYVYLQAKGDALNWNYIHGELSKQKNFGQDMDQYEEQLRLMAKRVFGDPEGFSWDALSEEEYTFLYGFLAYGAYGTKTKHLTMQLERLDPDGNSSPGKRKWLYVLNRLFPSPERLRYDHPFFDRHRWLLPLGYLYRIFCLGTVRIGKWTRELSMLRKV